MNNKYKIYKLLCVLASVILIICLLIIKIPTMKLMPFVLLNLAVYDIIKHNENKPKDSNKRFDGAKAVILSVIFLWCFIIAMGIVHNLVSLT